MPVPAHRGQFLANTMWPRTERTVPAPSHDTHAVSDTRWKPEPAHSWQRVVPRHGHRPFGAAPRLLEREPGLRVDVGAAVRAPAAGRRRRANTSSNRSPKVVVRSAWTRAEKSKPVNPNDAAASARAASLPGVVAAAPIGIDQRLVGLEHLAEAHRGLAVARIDVRVPAARQPPIGALDVAVAASR